MSDFPKSVRRAAELVTGPGEEADHINPRSKGGEASVENCQLISGTANRKKAAFSFVARDWQQEFFDRWERRREGIPFMLIAIPGSGKTWATLEVCRRWIRAGADRRIVIVVPTKNLQEQWRDEAAKFGIDLQTKEFGARFKDGFRGGVVTYALVANQSILFRAVCDAAPTMVIFDEVHHCGDEAHYGEGIKTAFSLARERLLMSGTPWKSDGTAIPYVKYDGGGFATADYSYDYPKALTDNVVRYLVFDYAKGSITNEVTGEVEEFGQSISDVDAQRRLRRLLDPSGDYVRRLISDSHRKLLEDRKKVPDAGALAACIDQHHASRVATVIKEVTGCSPSLIVSDSDLENDTVKRFRSSRKEWLVAVRKVSEGTDIKRLSVLCYLTNVTSELFFRQIIGRVSRYRGLEDLEGYVYLPSDPRLVRCAENIASAQIQALKSQSEEEGRELTQRQQGILDFDTYSTQHDGSELIQIGEENVPLDLAKRVEEMSEQTGVAMQKVLAIVRLAELGGLSANPVGADPEVDSKEQRLAKLRSKVNKLAFRAAKLLDVHVAEIHGRFSPQKNMGEESLEQKRDALIRLCQEASR